MASLEARTQGNEHFRKQEYFKAETCYRQALESCPKEDKAQLAIIYSNLSATQIRLEKSSEAINSATQAIELDPSNVKAYVRRASALVMGLDWMGAYKDFLAAAKIDPNNKGLREKLAFCKEKHLASQLRAAMATSESQDTLSTSIKAIEEDIEIPEFNEEYAVKVTSEMAQDRRPPYAILVAMIRRIKEMNMQMKNIVEINNARMIRVVGDTHGQFQDLCQIFEQYGNPSTENPYLFNGDYVDRGSMGIEILITLFAWKLANPNCIYLNRGNHETNAMNSLYGFEKECDAKYGSQMFKMMSDLFNTMPIGHVINSRVLVVHGGLFGDESVTVESIQQMNRFSQPPESGPLNDILWSDPMEEPGFAPSPRGVTRTFGPDVTERFLNNNNLELLIRSHQVQENGYAVMHNGKCITVFSAPNYVGQMGNQGAVVKLTFNEDGSIKDREFQRFQARPIPPNYRPMKYASFGSYF